MIRPSDTVTIFGATGFVGRYVVRRLAPGGCRIRLAARDPSKAARLRPCGVVGQIVPVACNIHDAAQVAEAIGPASIVINLTGILTEKGRSSFQAVHADLPAMIGKICAARGVERVVQVSAIGADGDSPSAYARSKAAGEAALKAAGVKPVIVRPSIIFGPEDSFFNRFASMALISPALPLIGGGETKFQPAYVGDVADAILTAVKDPKCAGKTYELGGPTIYSFRELMTLMLKEIRRERALVPLPWGAARGIARLTGWLPEPPITADQIIQLGFDNVVTKGALQFRTLGIEPTALEVILPTYMDRFRAGGRFNRGGAYQLGER